MSSSPTAATSTTRSSSSCSSPRNPTLSPTVAVIACGALGGHIREVTDPRGWPVELHHLPSLLHNHPERIAPAAERLARDLQARGLRGGLGSAGLGGDGARAQPVSRAD